MAAADALYEIMSLMVKKGPLSNMMINREEVDSDVSEEKVIKTEMYVGW